MAANQLLINDTLVSSLRVAMREGSFGLSNAPELVKRILRDGAWKERAIEQTGEVVSFASFAAFVAAPPLGGLGADLTAIKRLCRDDVEAVDLIDRVTQLKPGPQPETNNNIQELQPTGTSKAATIRRLRKDRPDLHTRVLAGELSPHAAAIEAGFRKRTITIPLDVDIAAQALRRHFTANDLATLRQLLTDED